MKQPGPLTRVEIEMPQIVRDLEPGTRRLDYTTVLIESLRLGRCRLSDPRYDPARDVFVFSVIPTL
jgi:hypothetical protein